MFSIETAKEKETMLLDHWSALLGNTTNLGKSRYKHISTNKVIDFFRKKDWIVRTVAGTNMTARHIVRMVHPDITVGEDRVEVVITNSYDRRSKLNIKLGVFRLVCSNGVTVGDIFGSVVQKHIGQNIEMELENKYAKIVAKAEELKDVVNKMKAVTNEGIAEIAEKVAIEAIGVKNTMYKVDVEELLKPVREADEDADVWTIMNVVQEKIINGGVPYLVQELEGEKTVIKRKKTKKRTNAYHTGKLNSFIFDEFSKLAA